MTDQADARGERVQTRDDLATFLAGLADSLLAEPAAWENDTLERFLRAWSAWITDMEGYFTNRGEETPATPSWELIAQMLLAAKIYE